ncbi:hypothetical protein D3C73_442960 [compost metagenome]
MGDDKACSAFHQRVHRLLDLDFSPCIDAACRFIENQDGRVRQNCPGNSQQLLLPLRNIGGFLVQNSVIAQRKCADKVIGMRSFGGPHHIGFCSTLTAIGDVVTDGSVEQPGILEHHTEFAAQLTALHISNVETVDDNLAAADFIEAHQQVDQRRFAGTGWPYNGNGLSGADLNVHVFNQNSIFLVAEFHMTEFNRAFFCIHWAFGQGRTDFRNFLLFIQKLKYTFCRSNRRLNNVGNIGCLRNRHGELARILDKCLNVPDINNLFGDKNTANHTHQHITQVPDEHHQRHDNTGNELRPPA